MDIKEIRGFGPKKVAFERDLLSPVVFRLDDRTGTPVQESGGRIDNPSLNAAYYSRACTLLYGRNGHPGKQRKRRFKTAPIAQLPGGCECGYRDHGTVIGVACPNCS